MEAGEKKFINGCISREIMKIVLKLVVCICQPKIRSTAH